MERGEKTQHIPKDWIVGKYNENKGNLFFKSSNKQCRAMFCFYLPDDFYVMYKYIFPE